MILTLQARRTRRKPLAPSRRRRRVSQPLVHRRTGKLHCHVAPPDRVSAIEGRGDSSALPSRFPHRCTSGWTASASRLWQAIRLALPPSADLPESSESSFEVAPRLLVV